MKKRISFILVGAAVAAPAGMAGSAVNASTAYMNPAPSTPVEVAPGIPFGSVCHSLPAGTRGVNINGIQYFVANGVYYRPYFGSNGVYYQVAPNPM